MNADELVEYYIEEVKREYMERDWDYEGDREAFRKRIEETGEEEGTTYLF